MDLPLYNQNFKVWRLMGFVGAKNKTRLICWSILPSITTVLQFMYMYKMKTNFPRLMLAFSSGFMRLDSLFRLYVITANEDKLEKILSEVNGFFEKCQRLNKQRSLDIFDKVVRDSGFFSMVTMANVALAVIGTILVAFITDGKLPADIFIPGIDVLQSPLYEICFAIQTVFVVPFVLCTHPVFTNLLITWLMFGIALLKDLSEDINDIKNTPNKIEELKNCIEYHKQIMRYIASCEDLVSVISFIEFMIFGISIMGLLVLLALIPDNAVRAPVMVFLWGTFYLVISQYWYANEIAEESMKVANAVYSSDWLDGDKQLKTCVLFMISRCQTPIKLSAGKIIPMNLQTFQKLMNTSYSIFTMIRQMVET